MKRQTVTRAQIERAIEAGKRKGAVALEIEANGVKLRYSLGGNAGDKSKEKLDKRAWKLI